MKKPTPTRRIKASEKGYMLVAVIFLLALLTIALAVALPKMSKEIQHDRELETMQRGKQYARGVKLYYKKFGAYPGSIDALVKPTNNIRFLRKKYVDLTTGKEDWKPVLLGQNKAPTAMGFFGQPLAGSSSGCASNPLGGSSLSGSSSTFGSSPIGSPGTGAAGLTAGNTNCAGAGLGTGTSGSSTTTTDPNAVNGAPAASGSATGATTGSSAGSSTGSTFGSSTSPVVGGASIIGFSPNSPKQSILVYKTKNHYNEWEFVYDPLADQTMQGSGSTGLNGQPAGSPSGGSAFGSPSGGSSAFGSSTFGTSSPGTSSTGTSPSPTTTTPP
jgi:type II secretory pathway pseudopilin PulG